MTIELKPIGIIHTPYIDLKGMPIQPGGATASGTIELSKEYIKGLQDLDGFSHIILIYNFHLTKNVDMIVKPFLDTQPRGIFSTRAPRRPNPIGMSVVKLKAIEGNFLSVDNIDVVDGTPLLDIKPYIAEFDGVEDSSVGWLEKSGSSVKSTLSDGRFV